MRIEIMNVETGEWLGTVTTRYNSLETLFENVSRWMRGHPQYRYVSAEELEAKGLVWELGKYYVEEV